MTDPLRYHAAQGQFTPQQIRHRARHIHSGHYVTACGQEFGGPNWTDWGDWGVGGPFDGDDWPSITCPRCPQPARPLADAIAALQRVRAEIDTWGDASRKQYYDDRHGKRGILYACGFEDGWNHAEQLIRDALDRS